MNAKSALAEYLETETVLAEEALPGGHRKQLLAKQSGPKFEVVDKPEIGERTVVCATSFHDEALTAYEKYDREFLCMHRAYLPRGFNGSDRKAEKTDVIFAASNTVRGCVEGFLDSIGEELERDTLVEDVAFDGHQWFCAFAAFSSGTGFKAAGRRVPGGYVMTWWK